MKGLLWVGLALVRGHEVVGFQRRDEPLGVGQHKFRALARVRGVAAARGNDALDRYSRHDALLNRADAFLLKIDGDD